MTVWLGKRTKLTHAVEKALVGIGDPNPDKTLTDDELRDALPKGIYVIPRGC